MPLTSTHPEIQIGSEGIHSLPLEWSIPRSRRDIPIPEGVFEVQTDMATVLLVSRSLLVTVGDLPVYTILRPQYLDLDQDSKSTSTVTLFAPPPKLEWSAGTHDHPGWR